MNSVGIPQDANLDTEFADVRDFIILLKPRVMSLVVFTALVGMVITAGHVHPVVAFAALICIAVGAGAAGALNMWYDADVDRLMTRTCARPVPLGRISPDVALSFGATLAICSVFSLGLFANWMAASLLAFTIVFYVVIYTIWLKRLTVQNIVIGGAAGALPPVIGAAVMAGVPTFDSLLLFLIIFLWTPPHFWALALYKSDDYARARIPMLPVIKGESETRRQILIYALLYVAVTQLPWLVGNASAIYMVTAIFSGVIFLLCSWRVYVKKPQAERQLFAFSILQLLLLFSARLADALFVS